MYKLILRVGLLTAAVILLFQVISLFVIYRWVRMDLYLTLVALLFLGLGYYLNKSRNRRGDQTNASRAQEIVSRTNLIREPAPEILGLLSAKELQVLRLVAEGKSNKEIAEIQFVELSTIKTHLNNIYGKLSVNNRKEARVRYAELAQKWPIS